MGEGDQVEFRTNSQVHAMAREAYQEFAILLRQTTV
jgi:hypothetical protein